MIKRILHITIWIALIAWFMVILGFVSRSNSALVCKQLAISVLDSGEVNFVTADMIREVILHSGFETQGYPVESIKTREIEMLVERDPYVENAEVFVNIDGDLQIEIEQRKPLMRVMPGGKRGYYIDHKGVIIPLSEHYSPMVLLVSGSIKMAEYKDEKGIRHIDIEEDLPMQQLMEFARYIDDHPFWNSQIVQLYRAKSGEYEIIPRVGAHQIQLGTLDEYELKLRNLKLLYDQGLKQYGWNSYNKINLKYSNQVICTKR